MNDKLKLEDIPQPPEGSVFKLVKLETVGMPHPYCIGTRHVAEASDHFSGMLGRDAILSAEKKGASCDICRDLQRKRGTPVLSYDEHETMLTLFISVPNNRADLNSIPGLGPYLQSVKDLNLGIDGFAFPNQ